MRFEGVEVRARLLTGSADQIANRKPGSTSSPVTSEAKIGAGAVIREAIERKLGSYWDACASRGTPGRGYVVPASCSLSDETLQSVCGWLNHIW